MSVSSTTRKQQFTLNGTTATLTFTFRALVSAPEDIKVTVTAASVDTELTYTTDYTVVVNSDGVGGVVTLLDPAGVGSGTATVFRETTNTQGSDYDDYNQFPADTVENDLDIRTLVSQEQAEDIARSLILPISVTGVSAELPVPVADKVLGWDSAGTALENKTFMPSTDLEKASVADANAGSNNSKYMTPSVSSIAILTAKTIPVSADSVRLNDSEASNVSKKCTITQLMQALNINGLGGKTTPVAADELLLSNSEASNTISKATIANISKAITGNVWHGIFTRDTTITSSTQAITGVGFKPTSIIFFAQQDGVAEMSWGFQTDSSHGNTANNMGMRGDNSFFYYNVTTGAILKNEDGSNLYAGYIVSWDADGFTITWVRSSTPTGTITVQYLAFR